MHISNTVKGRNFFKVYARQGVGLEKVVRVGFPTWGIYPSEEMESHELQTDAEHCHEMHTIAILLRWFYPEIFIDVDWLIVHDMIGIHEWGEVLLGDIRDNGSPEHAAKDLKEREYVFLAIDNSFPGSAKNVAKCDYQYFQNKSTKEGRVAFLCDKFEAVWRGLVYEWDGHGGSLSFVQNPTEQDIHGKEMSDSDSLVDNWLYNWLEKNSVEEYRPYVDVFLEITQSAICLVRGQCIHWLD